MKETLYNWPNEEVLNVGRASPLAVKKETVFAENQVTYMSDKVLAVVPTMETSVDAELPQLGLHKISNPDCNNVAVSLHCQCPHTPSHLSRHWRSIRKLEFHAD